MLLTLSSLVVSVCTSEDKLEKVKIGSITGAHSANPITALSLWDMSPTDHKAILESREPVQ